MIGVSIYGGSQVFTKVNPKTKEVLGTSEIYLQSAAFWYVPILIVLAILSWIYLRRIPVKASFKEQLDIFRNKHTWFCTITYMIGNAATFRQFPIIFGHNPRQAAGVIGWKAAIAAYGPFVFATSIGAVISSSGNARAFFIGLLAFVVLATLINWYYYNRKGCQKPS